MSPQPGVALQDVVFEEAPYIVQRGSEFYLRYRLAAGPDDSPAYRMMVDTKKAADRAYYFFIAPVSLPEQGHLIERSLSADGIAEFAARGAVYWLNPDGAQTPLEIRQDSSSPHKRE
jgi:hypothetical protein